MRCLCVVIVIVLVIAAVGPGLKVSFQKMVAFLDIAEIYRGYVHAGRIICIGIITMGYFQDAWWQQTYQVKSIVLDNVRTLRTT